MIARIALTVLLTWTVPAAAVCEFLCASGETHGHSHHSDVEAAADYAHDHHGEPSSGAPSGPGHDEGCCCIAVQLTAKKADAVFDVTPKLVGVLHAAPGKDVLLHNVVTTPRSGGPPGLPLDVFSERNRPLLN